MPSFFVHKSSPLGSRRLVAAETWAVAVRALVGRHDEGGLLARRLVDRFLDGLTPLVAVPGGDLREQRARLAEIVAATVEGTSAGDDDGIMFTLLVVSEGGVRGFNVGPQRTFLAGAGEPVTVLAPHSVAAQLHAGEAPSEQALISTRVANRRTTAGTIDVMEVELARRAWLVTQLDDRARPLALATSPASCEEMLVRLRHNTQDVPRPAHDWLLATRG